MKSHVALMALFVFAGAAWAAEPRTDWQETVAPGEAENFAAIAKEFNKMQDDAALDQGTKVDRGFHSKPHAVMRAQLTVADGLPEPYRQGVCAKPGSYKVWLRLSNGQTKRFEDRKGDIRGFAVKILDVPGEPLTPGIHSLDFLCINHAAQPARTIDQFIALIRASKNTLTAPVKLAAWVGLREAGRMLAWAAGHLGEKIPSMATHDFYTAVPLSWGKYAAKVRFAPKNGEPPQRVAGDSDYLRHEFQARLAKFDQKWDMMVQLYTDPQGTPIEDASVVWNSPWVKVGELTVTQRDLTSPAAQAEEAEGNALLWNPWNAPAEHRPLGSIMRARRVVYPSSAAHRGATHE